MTIWYDYTTTTRSTGRNGIANVEWSVGRALGQHRPDVRAFAVREGRRPVVIDPEVDLREAAYARPVAPTQVAPTLTRDRGLRVALGESIAAYAPWSMGALSSLLRVVRGLRSRIRRWSGLTREHRDLVEPLVERADVVVSLGADWSGELADALGRIRSRSGCLVVTMVYDLIPVTHPHLAFHNDPAFFGRYFERLLRVSDLIVCISEQTQLDLLDFAARRSLEVPETAVLRLGEHEPAGPLSNGADARGDFFLWVGTVERRKNLELLHDALKILDSEGDVLPTIVVAGAMGWGVDDLLAEIGLQSTAPSRSLVLLGPVEDDVLDGLYRRARALLFPSIYEGWGLPVREAAVRGCPVAVGDNPALREVVADLERATILPVDDPEPWARYMAETPPVQAPAEVHPWSSTAAQLSSVIEEVLYHREPMQPHR